MRSESSQTKYKQAPIARGHRDPPQEAHLEGPWSALSQGLGTPGGGAADAALGLLQAAQGPAENTGGRAGEATSQKKGHYHAKTGNEQYFHPNCFKIQNLDTYSEPSHSTLFIH